MLRESRNYKVLPSAVYVGERRLVRGEVIGSSEVGTSLRRLLEAGVLKQLIVQERAAADSSSFAINQRAAD